MRRTNLADGKSTEDKKSPIERMREECERLGVPFEDTTKENAGRRTLLFGFGGQGQCKGASKGGR
jgi:hypothetical protein